MEILAPVLAALALEGVLAGAQWLSSRRAPKAAGWSLNFLPTVLLVAGLEFSFLSEGDYTGALQSLFPLPVSLAAINLASVARKWANREKQ